MSIASAGTLRTVSMRKCRNSDFEGLANLLRRNGMGCLRRERWDTLWSANPALRGIREWPAGWVLENSAGAEVGFLGNIPLRYEYRGRSLVAAATHSWVVDADYRGSSLALIGQYFRQRGVDLLLNTTANQSATQLFDNAHIPRVPDGGGDRSLFWITNYPGFLAATLRAKRMPRIAGALRYPASALLWARDLVLRKTPPRCSGYRIFFRSGFDGFDEFWQRLRSEQSHRLMAVRDRETMEWRFAAAVARGHTWVITAENDHGIAGYALFQYQGSIQFGLSRMRLIDFQALSGSNHLIMSLIAHAVDRSRREGIHVLEAVGFSREKRDIMRRYAPYARAFPCWLYFYKATDPALAAELAHSDAWDICGYDGDGWIDWEE